MTIIIEGCDPGAKGAVAFVDPKRGWLYLHDLPVTKRTGSSRVITEADGIRLASLVKFHNPLHLYLEKVSSSPQMGVAGAFSFGDNYGTIKGVHSALDVPMSFVAPQTWKANLKVPADKKEALARARQLMPGCSELFTRADKAEAALIALYGCFHSGNIVEKRLIPAELCADKIFLDI